MSQTRRVAPRQLKILVADDTRLNLDILKVFLTKAGHDVITASNGYEAIECFVTERPDLIIMDVMMPVLDGFEATRQIKAIAADRWVPVIFLSALDKDENIVAGLDAGGDDYLPKPINFVVLEAKVNSYARTLQLQSSLEEQRREMAAVSANVADGLAAMDSAGRILWHSPSFSAMFGQEGGSLVGENAATVIAAERREEFVAIFRAFIDGDESVAGSTLRQEFLGQRREGTIITVELAMSRVVAEGVPRFVSVVHDITQRKEMEAHLRADGERLQQYYDAQEREQALTTEIMERVLQHPGLKDPAIRHWVLPTTGFSGDLVAAGRCAQDGRYYATLADATGHGLAAAVSALPYMAAFIGTANAGFDLSFIMPRINEVLRGMLPVGRFVAATVLCLDPRTHTAELWQGAMPVCLRLGADGTILGRWVSPSLALGVVRWDKAEIRTVDWTHDDQFILFSDGVIEAPDRHGEAFGLERLEQVLTGAAPDKRLEAVKRALESHTRDTEQVDDISLMIVDCRHVD